MIPPKLPSTEELQPALDRLASNPGSVVLVSIEHLETQNFPRVAYAWLSATEREALRVALTKARAKRSKTLADLGNQIQGDDSQTAHEG